MRPINSPPTSRRIGLTMSLVLLGGAACNNAASDDEDITTKQGALTPSTAPELDPTTIPRFQTNFQRFYSYVPTRNAAGPERVHGADQHVPDPAAAVGLPADDAVRVRRQRPHRPQRQSVAGRDRPDRVQAHVAGPEVRADQGRPGADPLSQPAHRIAPAGGRSDAGLGEPEQLPEAVAAVRAVPARVPAGAVADPAHDAHARHRGAPGVRRHARHVVHGRRHPRPGVRVERLHAAEQQPVGGVLVPRPRRSA